MIRLDQLNPAPRSIRLFPPVGLEIGTGIGNITAGNSQSDNGNYVRQRQKNLKRHFKTQGLETQLGCQGGEIRKKGALDQRLSDSTWELSKAG